MGEPWSCKPEMRVRFSPSPPSFMVGLVLVVSTGDCDSLSASSTLATHPKSYAGDGHGTPDCEGISNTRQSSQSRQKEGREPDGRACTKF